MTKAPELSVAELAEVARFGLDKPSDHTKILEDVIEWDCVWSECDHDGDCPIVEQEVCRECSGPESEDDFVSHVAWDYAERHNHSMPFLGSSLGGGKR